MKKILLFAIFLICSPGSAFNNIRDSINSHNLKEYRSFSISLPQSYDKNREKEYPLIVVLDAEYLFEPFSGELKYGAYWDIFPETILVGINQNIDDKRLDDSNYDPDSGLPYGKGAQFFEFIGEELLPYLDKRYRIAPFKIIAGHDVTAGFLNFFLYKKDPLFDGYISMSPELPPGMEVRVSEKIYSIKKRLFYYQSISKEDIPQILNHVYILDKNIKADNNDLVKYKFDEFENATHYSVVLHSIPNALCHFFEIYQPITSKEYSDKIMKLKTGHVEYLINKYENITKILGVEIPIRFNDFLAVQSAIVKNQNYEELGELADLAQKNYPKKMLSKYLYGLMHEKMGNYKKATKYYKDGSQLEAIGNLSTEMMLNKSEETRSKIPRN